MALGAALAVLLIASVWRGEIRFNNGSRRSHC